MERKLAIIWSTVLILVLLNLGNAHANVAHGKTKSAMCAACHGPLGISSNPLWPNLAKQKHGYLLKQLKAFRSGERKDPLMSPVSQTLTDDEISDLTDYYSNL